MFSVIQAVLVGAVLLTIAASSMLTLSGNTARQDLTNETQKIIAAAVEAYQEEGAWFAPTNSAFRSIGYTKPLSVRVLTDAWGGPLYLLPVCWSPASTFTQNTRERLHIRFIGVSGGPSRQVSPTLMAQLRTAEGEFDLPKLGSLCITAGTTTPPAAIPALWSTPDLLWMFSNEDVQRLGGARAAGASSKAGVGNLADGGGFIEQAWTLTEDRLNDGGGFDGELRLNTSEKRLYYWRKSTRTWRPVLGDPASVRGRCGAGWVFVPGSTLPDGSYEPPFCVTSGEVFDAAELAAEIDGDTAQALHVGLAALYPLADLRVKLTEGSGEPVHITPTLATYNEARAQCARMGPAGTLLTPRQLLSIQQSTGLTDFPGRLPAYESLAGSAGSPCKGTENGFNVCAVEPHRPSGSVSFVGTPQQRVSVLTVGNASQFLWDLGGNLAEWLDSGARPLLPSENALLRGPGLFVDGGPQVKTAATTDAASPTLSAGFRCSYKTY